MFITSTAIGFNIYFYSNSDLYIIHLPKIALATFIRKLCTTPVVKQIDGDRRL